VQRFHADMQTRDETLGLHGLIEVGRGALVKGEFLLEVRHGVGDPGRLAEMNDLLALGLGARFATDEHAILSGEIGLVAVHEGFGHGHRLVLGVGHNGGDLRRARTEHILHADVHRKGSFVDLGFVPLDRLEWGPVRGAIYQSDMGDLNVHQHLARLFLGLMIFVGH